MSSFPFFTMIEPLPHFFVARFNSDGSLDTSFGDNGSATAFGASDDDWATSIALQPDGKIVVAGALQSQPQNGLLPPDFSLALARYNANGSLDSTFGNGGTVVTPWGASVWAYGVAIDGQGHIVVAGTFTAPASLPQTDAPSNLANQVIFDFGGLPSAGVARFNSDGSLDTTFGNDGIATTNFGANFSEARSLALEPDGSVLVGGFVWTSDSGIDHLYISLAASPRTVASIPPTATAVTWSRLTWMPTVVLSK